MGNMSGSPASSTGRSTPGAYAPRPGAAPLPRMVLTHASMEARLILRNGEQLLLALVIPLVLLVAGTQARIVELGPGPRVDILLPGILALAVMSTSFTSLAIATGFERRYGVLKRLGSSPLPRVGLLFGKALGVLAIELVQVVVLVAVGIGLGWRPHDVPIAALGIIAFCAVGTVSFAALGLLLAGTLRAEATLAAANLIYLVLLIGGAVLIPLARYPEGMQAVIAWLPSGALAEGLRGATGAGEMSWTALGVLVLWAAAGGLVAGRAFRWD